MASAAAKREEIQLKLQELRERREREQAAFDAVAAAHPELSAQEITALAQKQAAADVAAASQVLVVNGEEVRVGDRVNVKDDLQLLHRADRGFFGPDVLKPIYLGERAEVIRVMASFQGKPAVELRFADDVKKVFFVECIETDTARAGTTAHRPASSSGGAGGRVDLADVPVFVPPPKTQAPPPKAETLPGWSQIVMPHRRPAGRQPTTTTPSAAAPAVAASASTPTTTTSATPQTPPPPPAAVDVTPVRKESCGRMQSGGQAAAPLMTSPIMKEAPPKARRGSLSAARESSPPLPAAPPSSSSTTTAAVAAVPIMKRPATAQGSNAGAGDAPSLSPPAVTKRVPLHAASATRDQEKAEEKQQPEQPRPAAKTAVQEKESTGSSDGSVAQHMQESTHDESLDGTGDRQLPQGCASTYQAKYALQDDATRIPRRQSASASGTRTCWVCGLRSSDAPLSEPVRVAFNSQCTAMFSLFAVLTRKLQWDKAQCTASRLYTDRGVEVKTAGAVRDGMRLVATTGCPYQPSAHAEAFSTVPEGQPATGNTPTTTSPTGAAGSAAASAARHAEATKGAEAAPAPPPKSPSSVKKSPAVLSQRKASVGSTGGAVSAGSPKQAPQHAGSAASSPSAAANKPRHIRVYENGFYDDNIYRTVTVRPTYKTLVALKTTITRELQWRDGKKVDLLYDACGAEIRDLAAICDGDVVVASAGDRFVIPYPNTPMHLEAMKLSERLNPSRKC